MLAEVFRRWLSKAEELTPTQRQRTVEGLRNERPPPDPLAAIIDPDPACPHCRHTPCGRWGSSHGLPRFRCARLRHDLQPPHQDATGAVTTSGVLG